MNKVWFLAAKVAAEVFTLRERFILVEVLVGKKNPTSFPGLFSLENGKGGNDCHILTLR